jgi:putative membrane protein
MVRSAKATLACAVVFSMAVGVGSASPQSSSSKPGAQRPAATADPHLFVVQAALANMAGIQFGHVATVKGQRPDVKRFAQVMIDAHVLAQKDLAEAASGAGIKWPTQMDDQHRQLKQNLATVKNDQFDRAYIKTIVDGHRDIEKMLADQVAGSRPPDATLAAKVTEWALRTLPAIRARLKEAEQLYGELEEGARSTRR